MHRSSGINVASLLALLGLLVSIAPVNASFSSAYCSTENTGSGSGNLWNFQSNGWCTNKCDGFAFAILLGKSCWCSNYAPGDGLTSTSDCSDSCAGFPEDKCGNEDKSLYLYLKMSDTAPSGTQGGSSPTSTSPSQVSSTSRSISSSSTTGPSTTPSQAPTSSTFTIRSSGAPATVTSTASSAAATDTPTPSTSSLFTTSPPQLTATPQTSTRIITQSGQVVTQTVVTTPTMSPAQESTQKSSSDNTGAIVGGVVGGVVGILAIAGLIVFLLFRRRKQQQQAGQEEEAGSGVHRGVSTMSRSGLLRSGNPPMAQQPPPIATSFNNRRQSSYMDQDSISPGSDRRNSRHLVDQRLNPSAIMYFDNSSRGSVASIDDSRDYHRPLNVRNPDPS